jgi:hydrogenase maturation protease
MNAVETEIRVMVIGFGNPLRGDDGVGWVAAQQLAERVDTEHVVTLAVHQLTPELAEPISRVELVIFVDASETSDPGQLSAEWIEPVEPAASAMTHQLTPNRLLGLARQLYGRCPRAELFTIGGADFGHREELSATVSHACDLLVRQLEWIVNRSLQRG